MTRYLAPGRNTKQDPGDTIRRNGLIASFSNKGIYGNYLDQFLFEAHGYEHILGTAAHVSADIATMTWDFVSGRFEDKAGSEVVLDDWDRIAVIGMDTLTNNITIDNVDNLEIFHIGNTPGQSGNNPKFELGDAGSGVPYKIFLGPNTNNCKLDLLTDKPFFDLDILNLTQVQKQYIANQGRGNYVRVNGEEIYNPSKSGDIFKRDTAAANPYFLRLDGSLWPLSADASVNAQAWFRDLNIALGGFFQNPGFSEYPSRFTPSATISASQYLFKLNSANRFFTDITNADTRVHQRTDPTGAAFTATAAFNGTNIVTLSSFPGNTRPRDGMRIQGGTVPGGSGATTILRNYDNVALTAEMYNALTGAAVNVATASGVSVTIDNSGAANGSHDTDYFQNITGEMLVRSDSANNPIIPQGTALGALSADTTTAWAGNTTLNASGVNNSQDKVYFDASGSTGARTHDQTQPKSSGAYFYYKV